jgi:hypothetical protein
MERQTASSWSVRQLAEETTDKWRDIQLLQVVRPTTGTKQLTDNKTD